MNWLIGIGLGALVVGGGYLLYTRAKPSSSAPAPGGKGDAGPGDLKAVTAGPLGAESHFLGVVGWREGAAKSGPGWLDFSSGSL